MRIEEKTVKVGIQIRRKINLFLQYMIFSANFFMFLTLLLMTNPQQFSFHPLAEKSDYTVIARTKKSISKFILAVGGGEGREIKKLHAFRQCLRARHLIPEVNMKS